MVSSPSHLQIACNNQSKVLGCLSTNRYFVEKYWY